MGRVYLGHSRAGRAVAVKVVHPYWAADAEFRRRFAREVAAARAVSGAYTASVVDADITGKPLWLATVFVPGDTLHARVIARGRLTPPEIRELGAALVEALAAIHAAGIVHRDLKPGNVVLSPDGPRIIDFGISAIRDASALTRTGTRLGTFAYMAPERFRDSSPIGPATDVYAFGALLTFAATGHGPHRTSDEHVLMYRIVHEAPELDDVPDHLRALISRCLAKRPEDRPTLAELANFLSPQLTEPHDIGNEHGTESGNDPDTQLSSAPTATAEITSAISTRPEPPAVLPAVDALRVSRRRAIILGTGAAVAIGAGSWWGATSATPTRGSSAPPGNRRTTTPAPPTTAAAAPVDTAVPWHAAFGSDDPTDSLTFADGGLYRVGAGLISLDPGTGKVIWQTPINAEGVPTAADGGVFVSDQSANTHRIAASTGHVVWSYFTQYYAPSTPAYADGIVYVTDEDGRLHAIDAANGSLRWRYAGTKLTTGSPTAANGTVYLCDRAGLHALDAVSGQKRWTFPIGAIHTPTPLAAGDAVYVMDYPSGVLHSLDATTGQERWHTAATEAGGYPQGLALAGRLVCVNSLTRIVAIDTNGQKKWTLPGTWGYGAYGHSMATFDDILFLYGGSSISTTYAINAATGTVRWTYNSAASTITAPAAGDGLVYTASTMTGVAALNALTGTAPTP